MSISRKAAQQNKKKKEEKKAKEEAKRNQIFETSSKLEQKIEEYLELEKMKRNGFTIMSEFWGKLTLLEQKNFQIDEE